MWPITDILIWGECFVAMAAVLSRKYPSKSSELFAYQCRIFHAARMYEGQNWVTYDQVYRRQAAFRRSIDWAQEDQALYNEAFGGRTRQSSRYRHCLSEHHGIEACPDLPLMPVAFPLVPPSVPAQHPSGQHRGPSVHPAVRSGEICRKFNENRCFFPPLTHVQFMQRPSPGVVMPGSPSRSLPSQGPTHLTGWQCG